VGPRVRRGRQQARAGSGWGRRAAQMAAGSERGRQVRSRGSRGGLCDSVGTVSCVLCLASREACTQCVLARRISVVFDGYLARNGISRFCSAVSSYGVH
jgi:hypothetical protein